MPTLVIEPGDDLAVMREEIFGPVLPIKTYRGLDQAIDYVNSHPRPLALYYFGTDTESATRCCGGRFQAAPRSIRRCFISSAENLPFGGVGASGIGAYHGEFGFQTFSHRKGVFLQSRLNASRFLYPPFGRLTDLMLKISQARLNAGRSLRWVQSRHLSRIAALERLNEPC